ncbi:PREDICTED: general odorant-binding protein 69a-like [Atta cephalotes]|uniref:Uncharacterized protein n=1 Tax=Atta cephalotes TaxID=12957 RepID=A0A158NUA4_ATTCE|nr:PREDICTED: general odorant-binding protein 69a-like [Atta cephalotes]
MKTIVILLAVSFAVLSEFTEADHAEREQNKQECIDESGVDPDVLEKAKKGELDDNDEKLACFDTCILKKFGVMKEDGEIDLDKIREHMLKRNKSEEQINKTINECGNVDGEGCQKGRNLMKCFMRVNGKH